MASTIQVRVDDDLKIKSDEYETLTEREILQKLEKSREHVTQGMFRDADAVSCDMREKYGL